MNRMRLFVVLTLVVSAATVSCRKEENKVSGTAYTVLGQAKEKTTGSGELFYLRCATLSQGTVTLQVVHGGKDAHEFSLSCDGRITVPDPDSCTTCTAMEIVVNHLGINENKTQLEFVQEVSFKLEDLKINIDDLNKVTTLLFKNSSDEGNRIGIWSPSSGYGQGGECSGTTGGGGGETDPDFISGLPVIVVKTNCTAGAWGELWLKTDLADDDPDKPAFTYLMPVEVQGNDSLPAYIPQEGDKLTGSFRKMASDKVCETLSKETQPVYIYGVTKR